MLEPEETKRNLTTGEISEEDNDNCSSSSGSSSSGSSGETRKTCVDCGTSKTPLWRGGPAGPKSLCNACGIKSRKKRQATIRVIPEEKKKKNRSNTGTPISHNSPRYKDVKSNDNDARNCNVKNNNRGVSRNSLLKQSRFSDLGFRVPMMKRSAMEKRPWRKLGEEEQAAMLLMALSCGSVYA